MGKTKKLIEKIKYLINAIYDNWGDLQSEICELITENERMEKSKNERRNKRAD